ncbi:hypothetical protein [Bacillus piscicola]|uniref:hypothetical protein n=1 Tax=Bacillus piscicola TaxID=1632684 RepID=UPI001F08F21D|nr:hypothetical protein [Bacillus piscicola]
MTTLSYRRSKQLREFLTIVENVNFALDDDFKRRIKRLQRFKAIATAFRQDGGIVSSIGLIMAEIIRLLEQINTTAIYEVAHKSAGEAGELIAVLQRDIEEVETGWHLI